jgi:hypothetical protein
MDFDFDPFGHVSVFLGIVLVVSIVAGSLPMIAVSALLLAVLAGLAYVMRGKRSSER